MRSRSSSRETQCQQQQMAKRHARGMRAGDHMVGASSE
jgi:hypothetical protein